MQTQINARYKNINTEFLPPIPPPMPIYDTLHNIPVLQYNIANTSSCQIKETNRIVTWRTKNLDNSQIKKFSSIGSTEHLLKLENLAKKNKFSYQENTENVVSKIIKRQNILKYSDSENSDEQYRNSTDEEF